MYILIKPGSGNQSLFYLFSGGGASSPEVHRGRPCGFCLQMGGLRPPNPPLFRGDRCLQKTTSVKSSTPSMLALKTSIADRQVVATIDAGASNKHLVIAMWIIYVCTRGRLCGSFCLQMGGAAPPPTPPLLKAIDACTKKTSISSSPCGSFMFAVGEFCADPFVCKWGGAAPSQPPRF